MFIAIVPAYNESKRIKSVVKSLIPQVDKVVVIDDASIDDTAVHAEAAGAIVLTHPINLGQGAALETGQVYARMLNADIVLHFDGDGQFDVRDIVQAKKIIESGVDVVLGSRFLGVSSQIPWFKRCIILPIARLVNWLFTGIKLTDAHNGFRMLGRRGLEHITITHNRMSHATEIISLIKKNNLTYREFPVSVTYHEYGQKVSGGFTIIKDLIIGKIIK
ncbi:MAG TPA: glycosyltransferase family 2 protein [Candidatus Magasanikbacteria bacterium]|nr:glycosyltransferase family 2 protein [Candidatus Magasanikbacteria bacterium]